MMADKDYAQELPTPAVMQERFREAVLYWSRRNAFIRAVRDMVNGHNKIQKPKASQYLPVEVRSYLLTAAVNEKRSRFLPVPEIAVVPESIGDERQARANELERAFNRAFYEMERNGGGNTWEMVKTDAIMVDEGIERIERFPGLAWPELVSLDGKPTRLELLYSDPDAYRKAREEYKKQAGFPMRSVYVPLENFFPINDVPHPVEAFEVEFRSVRSILSNQSFYPEGRAAVAEAFGNLSEAQQIRTLVPVIRYSNLWWYAYYVYTSTRWSSESPPTIHDIEAWVGSGTPVLVYAYEHMLGRIPYNQVSGRFGGWRYQTNQIEPVMRALLELNNAADALLSQVATNVRARYWPNLKWKLSVDRAGEGKAPVPPHFNPGEPIPLYTDEDIEPVFRAEVDPMSQWLYVELVNQFHRIAGSPVLYGEREPGVRTGYHHALQLSQAEHLDAILESNLAEGAMRRAELVAAHVKAMNERVWVSCRETHRRSERKYVEWVDLSPDELYPMPQLDARVRRPRAFDIAMAVRTAREASAPRRNGIGPLLSDDTIYEQILGIDDPDMEKRRIWYQTEVEKLFSDNFISNIIRERINMRLFEGEPDIKKAAGQNIDPALAQAIAAAGGRGEISPEVLAAVQAGAAPPPQPTTPTMPEGGLPLPGGYAPGEPQPAQAQGVAISNIMRALTGGG